MNRLVISLAVLCGTATSLTAAPPGVVDGKSIPLDFTSARRVGIQTNYTGVGDVTQLQSVPVLSEGSELDALYLAKDAQNLYVGLAGNLLELGSPFIILFDTPTPFDLGQTELWTEGVGGPAFMLQIAGRQVIVDDQGTPADGTDDTYTVVPNSGTLLPDCGDQDFEFLGWDYAIAIDASDGGTMDVHEYRLYGFQIGTANAGQTCHFGDSRGRVSCDPTPDNPNDPALPIFAQRQLVGSTPLDDGNETLEFLIPGGPQRGGFVNTNATGVTEVDASNAALATTGVEIALPLVNIGNTPLSGTETIRMLILVMDGDEYQASSVSDGYGTVTNQALPSLTGADCNPPASLGMRPDLSAVASCLTVDLSTLATMNAAAVIDGNIVPSDYSGGAPVLTQQCPTSAGDQAQLADVMQPTTAGSELDSLYVDHDDQYLYVGMTGNLEADGNSINVFVDTNAATGGGDAVLTNFSSFAFTGTYDQWNTATFTSGPDDLRIESTDFGGGYFDLNPNVNAFGATTLDVDFTVNAANQADTFRILLSDEDITERVYEFAIPAAPGTYSLSVALDNYAYENNPGAVAGLDLSDLSFIHVSGGFNNGDPGVVFDLTFDHLALSDDDAGHHKLAFAPDSSAFPVTLVSDFSNISLVGQYANWSQLSSVFTSGPSDFRVQAMAESPLFQSFGGGIVDISPNVDLSNGTTINLDVTLNPASSSGGTVLLVLADNDDSQLRWSWFNLGPGTYTLTANLASGTVAYDGSIPGFDFTDVSFFHLQTDFAVTDITFDNLSVTGVLPGIRPILGMNGDELPNGPLDVLGNGLFQSNRAVSYDYAYGINLGYGPPRAYVDYFDLTSDQFAFRGAVALNEGDSTLFDPPGDQTAQNPNGLQLAFDNTNIDGVIECLDEDAPCFMDDDATVAALAETATTGVEMAIPLADLGLSVSDFPRVIHLAAIVGQRSGYASNQSLPSMRNSSVEGNQVANPGEAPVNFTDPLSGPNAGALISDFSNFVPNGAYGVWNPMTDFTSGPDDFRVNSRDFGGCYAFLNPSVDASGSVELQLDVTLNPGNVTDRLVAILYDADGTIRVWVFTDLTNGPQTLTAALSDFTQEDAPGSEPGLDLTHLTQFNIAGAFHHGSPGVVMDVTFDNFRLVGGVRNFETRAARICLGTLQGDGDCDGDNDLIDIALMQQCLGQVPAPVFPMECQELDLVADGVIDELDFAAFEGLVGGPQGP